MLQLTCLGREDALSSRTRESSSLQITGAFRMLRCLFTNHWGIQDASLSLYKSLRHSGCFAVSLQITGAFRILRCLVTNHWGIQDALLSCYKSLVHSLQDALLSLYKSLLPVFRMLCCLLTNPGLQTTGAFRMLCCLVTNHWGIQDALLSCYKSQGHSGCFVVLLQITGAFRMLCCLFTNHIQDSTQSATHILHLSLGGYQSCECSRHLSKG